MTVDPDTPWRHTIDWNGFWLDADDEERAGAMPSVRHARDLLVEFIEERGVPDAVADVGCGPGPVAFDLAERHPETTVVGYDAAESVLAENRRRARDEGVENVSFERTVLPEFDPGGAFDLVFCHGTLCYVAESERAVANLYDAVAPGGHLVLGYTNRLAATHYRGMLENATNGEDGDEGSDAERFADRFPLVIEGENLLSYRRIRDAVGTWPRSFWSVVDKPEERWAWRNHPLVYVPK